MTVSIENTYPNTVSAFDKIFRNRVVIIISHTLIMCKIKIIISHTCIVHKYDFLYKKDTDLIGVSIIHLLSQ